MTRSCTVSLSSARGAVATPTSARGRSARIASATCAFSASTRSSGRRAAHRHHDLDEQLVADRPHPHALDRDHAGARARRARRIAVGRAGRRGVGQRVDGAPAEPPAGEADEQRDDQRGRGVRPGIAERDAAKPDQHRDRRPHVGAEMQRVGLQRLARGFVRHAVEQPRAEEIDHDRNDDHREGRRASPRPRGRGRRAAAAPPPRSPRRTARTAARSRRAR